MIPLPSDEAVIRVHQLFGDSETPAYNGQHARGCERPIVQPAPWPAAVLDAVQAQP